MKKIRGKKYEVLVVLNHILWKPCFEASVSNLEFVNFISDRSLAHVMLEIPA